MFIRTVSSCRTCFFFRVMWCEIILGSSAGTSISMVPTLYGPVYVGSDRPGTQGLSRKPRGGRDFGFFAFGTFVVCSLPSTGCLDGRGILADLMVCDDAERSKYTRGVALLTTRLRLHHSRVGTSTTPLNYARCRNSYCSPSVSRVYRSCRHRHSYHHWYGHWKMF
jgi:hypothetical protein